MINVDCDKMKDRFVYKAFFKAIARTATDVMALRTAFEAPPAEGAMSHGLISSIKVSLR